MYFIPYLNIKKSDLKYGLNGLYALLTWYSFSFFSFEKKKQILISSAYKMEIDEFRKRGKEMVDFIADYLENVK